MKTSADGQRKWAILILPLLVAGIFFGIGRYSANTNVQNPSEAVPNPEATVHSDSRQDPSAIRYPVNANGTANNGQKSTANSASDGTSSGEGSGASEPLGFADHLRKVFGAELSTELSKVLAQNTDLIRDIVVTVANGKAKTFPAEFFPLEAPPDKFRVTAGGGPLRMKSENFDRYRTYVELMQNVDLNQLVSLYAQTYPEFQKAYREMGRQGYFNDVAVDFIEHLLATPDADDEVELVQFTVSYKFANPDLEKLSAGQKVLIRVGAKNRQVIKDRLRQLRWKLTHLQ